MELRDFAEQVLFATTLEEKLRCPESITDEQPGSALNVPALPGRPADLIFKPAGASVGASDFPSLQRLEQASERGRLLHFFANHELLATELMALVLLRFPDAPAAFRRGVLQTLRDEQEHTRLYLARMGECGIRFGELPVSGYFWRSVAPMESPLDFVAGLSLTFEQANLDYARHFSRSLATVGDAESAALLDRIYRDEIGHVAHGLKWFRRWKQPGTSDWEAYCRQLKFPLSPQRAKGVSLNLEGRRAAGLDAAFIAELDVYSASKGRTPGVFLFNPFAEGFIAHGPNFTPGKFRAMLASDLANLPQFLARQGDVVLVPQRPSVEFLSGLKQASFLLPEFVELKAIPELAQRKLGRLRPWAWGPDSVALLAPLFAQVTDAARQEDECFNAGIASLYSKAWSAAFLGQVLQALPAEPWLSPPAEVGVTVNSYDEALAAISAIRARGHHRVVVKEAFGLAGSNALRLWEYELLETQQRWLAGAMALGRQLVVEPWLERVVDFSVQLEMETGGLKLIGYTGLRTDKRGQFMANWAEPEFARRLPGEMLAAFREDPGASRQLPRFYLELLPRLETELRRLRYLGPLGIDAFVYRDAEGHHRLKPVVEINPRHTMGRLTLELMRQVAPGSYGRFRIVSRTQARAEGAAEFPAFAKALAERHPVRLAGEPVGKIREGIVCLNDPVAAQWYLATFEVGSRSLVP